MSAFDLILRGSTGVTFSGILGAEDLFYRHGQSPYTGRVPRGRVVRTLVRGNEVFGGGKAASAPVRRLVRPAD